MLPAATQENVRMMKMKTKIENKDEVIKAARVAKATPESQQFWGEVKKRMDVREKSLVKPRKSAH